MSIATAVSFASGIDKIELLTIVATHFRQELFSKIVCKYPPLIVIWKMGLHALLSSKNRSLHLHVKGISSYVISSVLAISLEVI